MKHEVTATFKPCPAETFQVTVRASSGYPDAMAEAKALAVAGVHDLIADVLVQYRDRAEADTTE